MRLAVPLLCRFAEFGLLGSVYSRAGAFSMPYGFPTFGCDVFGMRVEESPGLGACEGGAPVFVRCDPLEGTVRTRIAVARPRTSGGISSQIQRFRRAVA